MTQEIENQEAKELSPEAKRALEEAQKRREELEAEKSKLAKEIGGRNGPEPTRFGDWEKSGIAHDF